MIPTCLAIILCDYMIEDKNTNNKSLIGLFNRINAPQFPCRHPRMVIYITLTDGHGKNPVEVFIERADDRHEVFKAGGMVDFVDPTHVIDLVFDLRGVSFANPGAYFAGLRTRDGRVIGERKFHVFKVELPQGPPPEGPTIGTDT